MSKLFLFSLAEVFDRISLDLMVIIINAIIVFASLIAIVLSIVKAGYGILKRLWIVPFMVGLTLIQLWLEMMINGYVKHAFLTVGIASALSVAGRNSVRMPSRSASISSRICPNTERMRSV